MTIRSVWERLFLGVLGLALLGMVIFGLCVWGTSRIPSAQARAQPMPVGDITGWHLVLADDFNGTTVDRLRWNIYSGQPGGDPAGWFDPAHVTVTHGMLVISGFRDRADGGRWATGGLSTTMAQTYGKYLVRFRFSAGDGIGHAILLWPADNMWPPEIDFSEDNGATRSQMLANMHYGPADQTITRSIAVDLTRWHTVGVEWTPGLLRYTLDGRVWSTVKRAVAPSVPMVLAIQTQAWPCHGSWGVCPDSHTPPVVRLYVDWIVAYAPVRR